MTLAASRQYTSGEMDRTIRMGAFLLVLAAAIALLLTQRMTIPGGILIASGMLAWNWKRHNWGNFWEIASFAYLLFFVVDLFRISGALAPALVHLFTFILVNKLFNLRTARDYYQLFLLTFLTVLAATSISVEIEMFYMIVVYIVLLVWNIASLTLYREWMQSRESYFPFSLLSLPYIGVVVASSLITFAIALGIFFIMPRMQLGFFGNLRQQKVQYVSGFSQKVDLGDINSIQADPDVAMRVRVTSKGNKVSGLKYWRGIAFDHYDGKSWSSTIPGAHRLFEDSANNYYAAKYAGPPESLIRQEFYMQPLDTRVVFGLDRVVRIQGTFGQVTRDFNGTFTASARPKMYEAWSVTPDLQQIRNSRDNIPEPVLRYYLQLPFQSERIQKLGQSIAGSAKTNFDRTIAIRNYLQRNFRYSTTDLPAQSGDPVSEFLFVKKSGHCEYFASTMVVMLRHLGVPARLVNGFREGEYNTIGDFYIIRNSDAHSWVEVYLAGQWVTMDPSPLAETVDGSSILAYLNPQRIMESISFFWDRYILIFSGQDQLDAVAELQDQYHALRDKMRDRYPLAEPFPEILRRFWRESRWGLAFAVVLGLMLFGAARLWARYRNQGRISRSPILFYQEMLSILAAKGFSRPPQSTPAEFLSAIEKNIPQQQRPDLEQLTDLFYRARFGGYSLTPSDQTLVRESLRRIRQW